MASTSTPATDRATAAAAGAFPVGYHHLHPDVSMNFQMNRWYSWVGEAEMLEEMRAAAPRILSYADWKKEFLALAENAARNGHRLRAGYYWRSAEFFMAAGDPDRKAARRAFLEAIESVYGSTIGDRHFVPYRDGAASGMLPAWRFKAANPKCTIVWFGGFDSYLEEMIATFLYLQAHGYDVIAFEGPGQGGALEEAGLPMTPHWQKPVAAVLDHFGVADVALVGLSLGGCLVIRAAAFEPRVRYVVAYDILSDFFDVNVRQLKPAIRLLARMLVRTGAAPVVNAVMAKVASGNPVAQWGVPHGMRVTGTQSPFEYMKAIASFRTADVSAQVRQHVLLLAGSEDHYVPIEQWHEQIRTLVHARSVTARLFTSAEGAQNHCQAGNYGLALRTIACWLDGMLQQDAAAT